MRFSIATVFALAASANALPMLGDLPAFISKFSDMANSVCSVEKVQQPSSSLPAPASGLKLTLLAIGKGFQNYTCPTPNNATAVPTAIGAVATLYNASCAAATANSDELANMTAGMEQMSDNSPLLRVLPVAGHHMFVDTSTPTFIMNGDLGTVMAKKNASSSAPASDKNAVPWLDLHAEAGQSSPIQQVYRLETANGAAPATCGDYTGAFEVPYAAEYWFYISS